MKISHMGTRLSVALFVTASFMCLQNLYAADIDPQNTTEKAVKKDTGVKGQIKEAKHKIAVERNAILAAGRRLREVRKTRDKAAIEQAKQEVSAEIKERKNAISVLKSEIERLQGSTESLAPSSKGAVER